MDPSLIFFAAMLALIWVFLIQPQRRRRRQQAQMLAELQAGDDVITAGGLYGRVHEVGADEVVLEIAPDTRVRVAKSAVAGRVPSGAQEPR